MPGKIKTPDVIIFSDGGFYPPTGVGSFACSIYYSDNVIHIFGNDSGPMVTSPRMELTAAIVGLRNVFVPCNIQLYSDNKYVVDGINSWMHNWQRNGWRKTNTSTTEIKNSDLWTIMYDIVNFHKRVDAIWVPGHSRIVQNEVVDSLCTYARSCM